MSSRLFIALILLFSTFKTFVFVVFNVMLVLFCLLITTYSLKDGNVLFSDFALKQNQHLFCILMNHASKESCYNVL